MVSKRSLLAVAGAVLMVSALAPLALAQSTEEVEPQASPAPAAELTQAQLDDILARLTDLAARVESLEAELAKQSAPKAKAKSGKAAVPKAPVATGETARRFTVRDPDPDRGLVTWKDRATDEKGYRVHARRLYCGLKAGVEPDQAFDRDDFTEKRSGFVRVATLPADATEFRPVHLQLRKDLPDQPKPRYGSGEIYELFTTAFNKAGESKRVLVGTYITTPEFLCP